MGCFRQKFFIVLLGVSILGGGEAFSAAPQCRDLFAENAAENALSKNDSKTQATESEKALESRIHQAYEAYSNSGNRLLSSTNYQKHLKALGEFGKSLQTMDETSHPELKNPHFQKLLKNIILHPSRRLTASEIELASSHKTYKSVVQNTLRVMLVGELHLRFARHLMRFWFGEVKHPAIFYQKGLRTKSLRALKAFYNGPARVLSPVPLPRILMKSDRIFAEQFLNPERQLTPEETRILEEAGGLTAYKDKQDFMQAHPNWARFRRWVQIGLVTALSLNTLFVANFALHLSGDDALVSVDEFVSNSTYRLESSQVRIYNESVPFPHMAIEIDGRVYSYGQTHMTVSSATEYLLSQDIAGLLRARAVAEGELKETNTLLSRVFQLTGLNNMPRSVQMITLNLPQEAKDRLKRSLEMSTGMRYRNNTLVMDCASMIAMALQDNAAVPIPKIIDASPSSVMMYLAGLKTLAIKNADGTPLVGDIKQVAMGAKDNSQLHLFRNLMINSLEGKIFWYNFALEAAHRTYLDIRFGKKNFQYWDPEVRSQVESWQKTVEDEFIEGVVGDQINRFHDEATQLASVPVTGRDVTWADRMQRFRDILIGYMRSEQATDLEKVNSPDTSFEDTIRAAYRYESFGALQENLITISEGRTPTAGPPPAGEILDSVRRSK